MTAKREAPAARSARTRGTTPSRRPGRANADRRRSDGSGRAAQRRAADAPPDNGRPPRATGSAAAREKRPLRSGPQTTPIQRPTRPKSARQAKARAKARKAKAPRAIRAPLRERLIARLASIDLRPRTVAGKVPFVVLVISSLGFGLAATLWLSTYSAERSYQLGTARQTTNALTQQKEALERDVLEAQAAPALAEAARGLGMIPSRDTAHLVQDPAGNWVVVGTPKPAEGVPPPPLNAKLPDDKPPAPPVNRTEVPVRVPAAAGASVPPANGLTASGPGAPEVLVRTPAPAAGLPPAPAAPLGEPHGAAATAPGPAPGQSAPPADVTAPTAGAPVAAPAEPQAVVAQQPPGPLPAAPPADAPQPANPPNAPARGEQFSTVATPTPTPPA
jgi:hypothetical protein